MRLRRRGRGWLGRIGGGGGEVGVGGMCGDGVRWGGGARIVQTRVWGKPNQVRLVRPDFAAHSFPFRQLTRSLFAHDPNDIAL